jgi:hypothetical protein
MGVFHGEYPDDLGKVVRHARRFADVLAKMERKGVPGDWVVGRAGEVRAIVSYFLEDWRNGVSEKDKTLEAISAYLDSVHRAASQRPTCVAVVVQCCGSDEAITLVPLGADANPFHCDDRAGRLEGYAGDPGAL